MFDSILGGVKIVTTHNHSLRVQHVCKVMAVIVRYRLTIMTICTTIINGYRFLSESNPRLHASDFGRINPSTPRLTL